MGAVLAAGRARPLGERDPAGRPTESVHAGLLRQEVALGHVASHHAPLGDAHAAPRRRPRLRAGEVGRRGRGARLRDAWIVEVAVVIRGARARRWCCGLCLCGLRGRRGRLRDHRDRLRLDALDRRAAGESQRREDERLGRRSQSELSRIRWSRGPCDARRPGTPQRCANAWSSSRGSGRTGTGDDSIGSPQPTARPSEEGRGGEDMSPNQIAPSSTASAERQSGRRKRLVVSSRSRSSPRSGASTSRVMKKPRPAWRTWASPSSRVKTTR